MLHVSFTCRYCTQVLHASITCGYCLQVLHAGIACKYCMQMAPETKSREADRKSQQLFYQQIGKRIRNQNESADNGQQGGLQMLRLTVSAEEYLMIGNDVKIVFLGGSKNHLRIMIDAPKELNVVRNKVLEAKITDPEEKEKLPHYYAVPDLPERFRKKRGSAQHPAEKPQNDFSKRRIVTSDAPKRQIITSDAAARRIITSDSAKRQIAANDPA